MNSNTRWGFAATATLRAALALSTAVPAGTAAFLGGVFAIGAIAVSTAEAQVVSSGMTGSVRSREGQAIEGATVIATHVPTGTVYTTSTRQNGRYIVRGMVVGGPYTVTVAADGYGGGERTDVVTSLGADVETSFVLELGSSEVIELEEMTIQDDAYSLNAAATGAGSLLHAGRLESKPTTQRSLADLISASPMVTLRATIGDREESQLSALGQNNRYNSILIDGARINDQFGLNMTGLASFFNPLSIDTIEQLSVQVSPYDVRQAGFTGATINAVTKSGTNEFHGTVYYIFGGDELWGLQFQGEDTGTRINTGNKVVPQLERTTHGFTLGGPIIKNRLFFFVNYEKFERISAPGAPGLLAVNDADMTAFVNRLEQYNSASGQDIPWGENIVGTAVTNATSDEKKLAKIDWNISSNHRASVRYSTTEGVLPQYGKYQNTQVVNVAPGGVSTFVSSGATALSTHIYSQQRKEEVWAAQFFSQWTSDFRTEIKYSQVSQDQDTPLAVVAPEVAVFGLRGTNRSGAPITNAAYVAGTEFSRQGNQIYVDSKNYSAIADYNWKNVTFTGGVEREESDYFNIFRNGSFGTVVFANLDDFLADRPSRIDRVVYDPALRTNIADISDYATNGVFVQGKWNANPRLSMIAGLRYEFAETGVAPPRNDLFIQRTGFDNTGTIDGSDAISPRIGFNLALTEDRDIQLRGGIGHFLGRAPWVLFSNSYNNPGVGTFSIVNDVRTTANPTATLPAGSFTTYLQNFDVTNPIGTGTDNPNAVRQVDWIDDGLSLPAVWRGNLAVDMRVKPLKATLSVEIAHTINDEQFFITNENLKPLIASPTVGPSVGLDGRQRFSGGPSGTAANSQFVGYQNLYRIQNTSVGESTYASIALDRPMQGGWAYNVSYTYGQASDAHSFGQTTASGQWQRNVVFNQSEVEVGRSDFEIKHRVQLLLSKEFRIIRDWKTQVSLYYEGRHGDPFSWTYSSDLNGDGQTANDTVAVPSDVNDPRFNFTGMPGAMIDSYFAFLESSGLNKYAGGVAPKNGFHAPWVGRLDLKLSQSIPIRGPASLELFLDFINFGAFIDEGMFGGYFLEPNQKHFGSEMFRRNRLGPAVYGSDGRIIPQKSSATAASFTAFSPDNFVYENGQSRWKIQVGARLKF